MSNYIINGELRRETTAIVSDRGFLYGDGFFETMIYENRQVKFLDDHLNRIQSACSVAEIDFPENIDANRLTQMVQQLCKVDNLEASARVKLIIWRKDGGLFTPATNSSNFLMQVTTLKKAPETKALVVVSNKVRNFPTATSQFKTLSCMQYILAGLEMKNRKVDDLIILDNENNVSECSSSNIFWAKGNQLFTPDKSTGCIEGVQKKNLLNLFRQNNIEVHSGRYTLNNLLEADLVFTSNVSGISKIQQIEHTVFDNTIDLKTVYPFLYTATGALI